jgi:hypothetical protein
MNLQIPETLYCVMLLQRTLLIDGVSQELPDGYYVLPVFSDREQAIKFAKGIGEIMELEKPVAKIVKMT